MALILDADVIIRGEKGLFDLAGWCATKSTDRFMIAAITVAELWHGVERAREPHRQRRMRYLRTFLAPLPVLPYTAQTALVHARIWAAVESGGKMISAYDLVVAATALEHACGVCTFNTRHYRNVPGLEVVEPGQD